MDDRLDDELRALRSEPLPAGYQRLEARVWQGIGALGLGVASGGATAVAVAAQSEEVSAFSAKAELAPSTLLDHHG